MKVFRVCLGLLLVISLILSMGVAQADSEENSSRIQNLQADVEDLQSLVSTLQEQLTILTNQVTALAPLQALTDYVYVDTRTLNELVGPHVIVEGANLHVRNDSGISSSIDGLGNLIVGYNECIEGDCVGIPVDRSGSHNLVVGDEHEYSSWGGFVAGRNNKITGLNSSVIGGFANQAIGHWTSVSGGHDNKAIGIDASVSGGSGNIASGRFASVSGGNRNAASGELSSVSGGRDNIASEEGASVSGGIVNEANGTYASISGGQSNLASGHTSSVSGGGYNIASGGAASVGGGYHQFPESRYDWAAGGIMSTAYFLEISHERDVVMSSGINVNIQSAATLDLSSALIQLNGPGRPAARVGDLVPAAPGPIATGSPTVLIGGGP